MPYWIHFWWNKVFIFPTQGGSKNVRGGKKGGKWEIGAKGYSTSIVWEWCMVLIAFCAIALVANVTNAQPVGGITIGKGGREGQEETKTRQKKVWTTRYEPQKTDITVQKMATPKHTEPPSLVSTWRKNTTRRTVNTGHMSTMINRLSCHQEARLCGVKGKTIDVIVSKQMHTYTVIGWNNSGLETTKKNN